jgi:tetratricopeptide (TPR) repeat protein
MCMLSVDEVVDRILTFSAVDFWRVEGCVVRFVSKERRTGLRRWVQGTLPLLVVIASFSLALHGQSQQPATGQKTPTTDGQTGDANKPAAEGNPFPGEGTAAPVLPTNNLPEAYTNDEAIEISRNLPQMDTDPVRSPEDSESIAVQPSGIDALESSSLTGVHDSAPDDDSATGREGRGSGGRGGHGKKSTADVPVHKETAAEDVDVGNLYLDRKNWKAALSRFQSARVLDPENPDAFFGMAEAEFHMGDKVNAKAHYEKLLEYDPDSKHARAAKKALKDLGEGK